MLFSLLLHALPVALQFVGAQATPLELQKQQASINKFIKSQSQISINGVLANIGPNGSKAPGVPAGILIASPSRSDPDYFFTWTRDAALTYKALIERFVEGDNSLRQKIDDYVSAQAELQLVTNPSGEPTTGGLGEPKFHVNKTAFTGSWGRPQRDGPPLRATALTIYANWLVAHGRKTQAANTVWPVIAKDLAYTVRYWNRTGFDLWEEINGSSFFTLSASHRALVEGAALASKLGKKCEGCADAAPQVLCFLQSFWAGSFIDSNINVNDGRIGKDVNSIISSIHTFDPQAKCTDATFQPCSSRALANHKAVTDSFRTVYAINRGIAQGRAVAVGRYAEDVYYNGNPWYLATLAAAEQLYAAVYQWNRLGSITIDSTSLPFFRDLLPSIAPGRYNKRSKEFSAIISAVSTYGDDFLAVVQKYAPASGALAEQFDKSTGTPLSAVDLTWSYAAFLTAVSRRSNDVGPTWGEPAANVVPGVCTAPPSCSTLTTFNVRATTVPGEDIFIVGGIPELANWSPEAGVPLSADKYSSSDPLWYVNVTLPSDTVVEYKYIRKLGGVVTWESDPNRRAVVGSTCGGVLGVEDVWR